MNRAQFQIQNSSAIKLLEDYADATVGINNIVVGSISLIALTQVNHYYRNVKDIDALVDIQHRRLFEERMQKLGYIQTTFLPIIGKLFAGSNTRFTKQGFPDLDVSYISIAIKDESLELTKSFMMFILPVGAIVKTEFFGIEISTFSAEATKLSKQILNRTVGRIIWKGKAKRRVDMENLNKLVKHKEYERLIKKVRFSLGRTVHKLPRFIYK